MIFQNGRRMRLNVRLRLLTTFIVILAGITAASAETFVMRISTENSEQHFQTRIVHRFAEAVTRRSVGRLEARHSASGFLFRDRDVVEAMQLGQLEMAVPGTWQIDRRVPDVALFQLPYFYGRDAKSIQDVLDGEPGRILSRRIEDKLQLVVLGGWIDLGFAHLFGVGNEIRCYEDVKKRRIRVAGGQGNISRLEGLGASAFVVPWTDLPAALSQKTVDGILTTFATVESAGLWKNGVNSAFVDRQYFAHYVPLISRRFWDRLPDELKAILRDAWQAEFAQARLLAAEAQSSALKTFLDNGGHVVEPSEESRRSARQALMVDQKRLIAVLDIDPALVDVTMALVGP